MLSSSRILCGLTRHNRHVISEVFSIHKTIQCNKLIPPSPGNFKACLSSVSQIPDVLVTDDEKHNSKSHERNNEDRTSVGKHFHRPLNSQDALHKSLKKDVDFSHTDPDTFGTLTGNTSTPIESLEGDEGDRREEEMLENPPSARRKLSTKQYATLIKDFFQEKKVAKAIDILETRMLKVDRVKPENYIYNLIISECGRLGYSKKAFQLYNQMKKRALKVTGATYTALFNSCANSPWPTDGFKRATHLRNLMFEKGYEPNASNYHSMIKAFGRCGDLATAFTLVDEMAEKKIEISNETFNFLLQACITDKDAGFRHALLVWRKRIRRKVIPDIYSYNLLLRAIRECGLGELDVAHDVFNKILTGGNNVEQRNQSKRIPMLTAETEDSPIQLLSSEQGSSTSEEKMLESYSSVSEETNVFVENRPNLLADRPHLGNIIALSEISRPEDRLILVGGCSGFLEQMKRDEVQPDIKTFTELIDSIPSTNSAEKALLTAMEKSGTEPDIDFFNMLIKKRSMRFDYKSARDVLHLIQRRKLLPDIVTFGVLALGCKTQEEAERLLQDMRERNFRMNAEILGAMLRMGCSRFNFQYVLAILQTAKNEEVRPNKIFYKHLEKFHEQCVNIIKVKGSELPHHYKEGTKQKFKRHFQAFSTEYNAWLKETVPEKEYNHPWEQFQNKTETGHSPINEEKKPPRRRKAKNVH